MANVVMVSTTPLRLPMTPSNADGKFLIAKFERMAAKLLPTTAPTGALNCKNNRLFFDTLVSNLLKIRYIAGIIKIPVPSPI